MKFFRDKSDDNSNDNCGTWVSQTSAKIPNAGDPGMKFFRDKSDDNSNDDWGTWVSQTSPKAHQSEQKLRPPPPAGPPPAHCYQAWEEQRGRKRYADSLEKEANRAWNEYLYLVAFQ